MDLRNLKYFIAAAEEGTISQAAIRCHIAQPSISSAISQLEAEFNSKLFLRSKKGVSLTAFGDRFYQQAKSLLREASAFEAKFKYKDALPIIEVGINVQLHSIDAAHIIKRLQEQAQSFQFKISVNHQNPDLEITSMGYSATQSGSNKQDFFPFMNHTYALLIPKGWKIPPPTDAHALLEYPWIDRIGCPNRSEFLKHFPQIEKLSTIQVESEDLALRLVQSKLGVTIMATGNETIEGVEKVNVSLLNLDSYQFRQIGILARTTIPDAVRFALKQLSI